MSSETNPFATSVADSEQSVDVEENLQFTARIVKLLSLCCAAGALYGGYCVYMAFHYAYDLIMENHNFELVFFAIDFGEVICYLILASRGLHYGRALSKSASSGSADYAEYVESQTWIWLAIGLFVFLRMAKSGIIFSVSWWWQSIPC